MWLHCDRRYFKIEGQIDDGTRFLIIAGENGSALLLSKAKNERQLAAVGNQCGGAVMGFISTSDFNHDYITWKLQCLKIYMGYENTWDLIQRS